MRLLQHGSEHVIEPWQQALANLPSDACIVGVDEVGRGPLAGDVVAAAVVLNTANPVAELNDSKKLTERKRYLLSEQIRARASAFAIAGASPEEIDRINILQASLLAMARAVDDLVETLKVQPDLILVDGNKLPKWSYPAYAIVKGDSLVPAISAASIVAKVHRDEAMKHCHERWPMYGFDRHKGYPTKAHLDALARHGACEIHRRSFGPVRSELASRGEKIS